MSSNRWVKLNARQLDVLQWISEGCADGHWHENDFSYKVSAVALRNRGLAIVRGHGPSWKASITEAGTYYLQNDTYPPGHREVVAVRVRGRHSAAPGSLELGKGAATTLDEAKALIAQLQEEDARSITITDPEASTRARYRRVLHACRQHHLVPAGYELRSTGRDGGDIVIALTDGSDEATSNWERIRTNARKITTNVDALRTALESTPSVIVASDELRPRAIEFVTLLASELRLHGLKLGVNVKLKRPKLFLQTETAHRDVHLAEVLNEVPHVRTAAEERAAPRTPWKAPSTVDHVPSGVLRITVARDGWKDGRSNRDEWTDMPKVQLEKRVRSIAGAIKAGVVDDIDARQREAQARAEAHEKWERQQAEERRAWEEVRDRARARAVEQLREATFVAAFDAWRGAQELRVFAEQLHAAAAASETASDRPRLREWVGWARARADQMDPIVNLEQLDDSVFEMEPTADELRPFMEGWDPSAPHKDYTLAYNASANKQATQMPAPKPWHPGMRGKPSWWYR